MPRKKIIFSNQHSETGQNSRPSVVIRTRTLTAEQRNKLLGVYSPGELEFLLDNEKMTFGKMVDQVLAATILEGTPTSQDEQGRRSIQLDLPWEHCQLCSARGEKRKMKRCEECDLWFHTACLKNGIPPGQYSRKCPFDGTELIVIRYG